jgi:alpha-D-xyloside xylohydrolase
MRVLGTATRGIGALRWSFVIVAVIGFGEVAAGQQIAISRGEATVLVEPYAANVVRVSLSLRRDDALAGPGYGISAKAEGAGWVAESSEAGDVLRS